MIMVKICGIILILSSTCGIGFCISNMMKLRLSELLELKKLILMLRGEIKYTGTPLGEAFGIIGRRTKGIYADMFLQTADELNELNGKSFLKEVLG